MGTPMYFDSLLDRCSPFDASPVDSDSHHLLAGRPRESSSGASLTLILRIGDNWGLYPDDQFALFPGVLDGDAGTLAGLVAESGVCIISLAEFMESFRVGGSGLRMVIASA